MTGKRHDGPLSRPPERTAHAQVDNEIYKLQFNIMQFKTAQMLDQIAC